MIRALRTIGFLAMVAACTLPVRKDEVDAGSPVAAPAKAILSPGILASGKAEAAGAPVASGGHATPNPAASTTNTAGTCVCRPLNGQPGLQFNQPLCTAVSAPRCKCESNSYLMCMEPWTKGASELACAKKNEYLAGRAPGGACTGYTNGQDKQGNPRNEAVSGTYECQFCSNLRTYGGRSGDSCTGFSMDAGKPFKGEIDCD
jgi:hypothetical protein